MTPFAAWRLDPERAAPERLLRWVLERAAAAGLLVDQLGETVALLGARAAPPRRAGEEQGGAPVEDAPARPRI